MAFREKIDTYGDGVGYVMLVDAMQTDASLKVVNTARASYNKSVTTVTEKDKKLIKFLDVNQHTSPFRHTTYTFELCLPLFVFRQWVKYQIGCGWREYTVEGVEVTDRVFLEIADLQFDTDKGCSWNELSARYSELSPSFYVPDKMRTNAGHANKQASSEPSDWTDSFHSSWKDKLISKYKDDYQFYLEMIEKGIAKEIARTSLPTAIYTKAYWTCSLSALLHFLQQRLDPNAQYEIRKPAQDIKKLVQNYLDQDKKTTIDLTELIESNGKV